MDEGLHEIFSVITHSFSSYLYLFDTYCSLVRIFGKSNVVLLLLYLRSVEPAVWVKDELRKCHVIFSLYQSTDREKCNANYTEPWKTKIRINPVFAYSKFNTQTKPQGTCLQVNSCAGKFNTVSAKALKLKCSWEGKIETLVRSSEALTCANFIAFGGVFKNS